MVGGGHNGRGREDTMVARGHYGKGGEDIMVTEGHNGKRVTGGHNGREDILAHNIRALLDELQFEIFTSKLFISHASSRYITKKYNMNI